MIPRRLIAALVAACLIALPELASACPACLGNPRNMSVLKLVVGIPMLFPALYAVVLIVESVARSAMTWAT